MFQQTPQYPRDSLCYRKLTTSIPKVILRFLALILLGVSKRYLLISNQKHSDYLCMVQLVKRERTLLFFILLLVIMTCSPLKGQEPDTRPQPIPGIKLDLTWDNDFWFRRDYYYTNGFSLEFNSKDLLLYRLARPKRVTKQPKNHTAGIIINHKIFTPSAFNRPTINFDRPFVSYLSTGYKYQTFNSILNRRMAYTLNLGIQGRFSGGETIQNSLHEIFPGSERLPEWEYQLNSDIVFNYITRIEQGFINRENLMIVGIGEIAIGSPQTYFMPGVYARIGKFGNYFSEYDISHDNTWHYFLFLEGTYKLKLVDTTIQGGILSHLHPYASNKITKSISNIISGFKVSKQGVGLKFSVHYLTKEVENGRDHIYGSLSFQFLIP